MVRLARRATNNRTEFKLMPYEPAANETHCCGKQFGYTVNSYNAVILPELTEENHQAQIKPQPGQKIVFIDVPFLERD